MQRARSGLRATHHGLGTGIRLASRRTRGFASHRRPPSRLAGASHFQTVRGPRLHGTWRPPGTIPLASVAPAGTVPSGAPSIVRERRIRRALGENAKESSKNIKIQRLRTSSNRRLLPTIPPRRAKANSLARSCCMRRSQAGVSSKIICSARAASM